MRQKYMIDGMPPTGPAWSVATTGVASWILRGIAVVIGLVCVVTMTVATVGTGLIVLAVLGSVHRSRRRKGRPLTLFQSYLTAVITMTIIVAAAFVVGVAQTDPKSGKTVWASLITTADTLKPRPQPTPRILRFLPGANIQPAPLPKSANVALFIVGFFIGAEMLGGMLGSLLWGSTWILVSGWTGRLAGVHQVVDEGRAPA
jgi:lysylphosphatidylglycerol synthetase-like protein (DUF2156 family)